jgi:cell wall-associated NlpC family hydrolase
MIVDASSAQKKVVERKIWTSGVVRYGRVPRPDMPPVKPWTPPPAPPPPTAAPAPAAPAAPAAAPPDRGPTLVAATARLVPLKGLPAPDLPAASAVAARAARNATTVTGSRNWTDLALVRVAWHHAGGGDLPATAVGIAAKARPVPIGQARIGDLVVYGQPASHVGYYLGHGYMVDASPSLKRVVVRRVFVSPTVRVMRPSAA